MGRGGPISWPSRSPDLMPLEFFFLQIKITSMEAVVHADNVEALEHRITRAIEITTLEMLERVWAD
jgi:hypothetical protein